MKKLILVIGVLFILKMEQGSQRRYYCDDCDHWKVGNEMVTGYDMYDDPRASVSLDRVEWVGFAPGLYFSKEDHE